MALDLRPYQSEAITAIEGAERRGVRRPLLGLPTETGKTVIFGALIARRGGRALVLAHRDEPLVQATEKIRQIAPGTKLGLVKAEANEVEAPVVVASMQTLARETRLCNCRGASTRSSSMRPITRRLSPIAIRARRVSRAKDRSIAWREGRRRAIVRP
jgi:superfamily II DNA or RNA helicase